MVDDMGTRALEQFPWFQGMSGPTQGRDTGEHSWRASLADGLWLVSRQPVSTEELDYADDEFAPGIGMCVERLTETASLVGVTLPDDVMALGSRRQVATQDIAGRAELGVVLLDGAPYVAAGWTYSEGALFATVVDGSWVSGLGHGAKGGKSWRLETRR